MGINSSEVLGNLPPDSTPVNPACLASDKHVSRDVSPPSSGISSLLQAIGAIPNFTDILFIFVRIMQISVLKTIKNL